MKRWTWRFVYPLLLVIASTAMLRTITAADEPKKRSPEEIARIALDEQTDGKRREAILNNNVEQAAEVVAAMAADLPADATEEYRRIPWIWRISIAAGRANDADVLRRLLDVSLPDKDQPLRDWQAVVIGGGIVNGLTQADVWPQERIAALVKDAALQARWQRSIELASQMADNEQVPTGTRYDALRMLGASSWETYGEQLTQYLDKDAHPELQMGAVSGAGDVDDPAAARALISALAGLNEGNRKLAVEALLRNAARRQLLREALTQGRAEESWLDNEQRERLHK